MRAQFHGAQIPVSVPCFSCLRRSKTDPVTPLLLGGIECLIGGGNSLDNSIRFHRMVETRWLLCDVQIHGVANGFAHGRMHIFAETGELIATASQSLILRLWD